MGLVICVRVGSVDFRNAHLTFYLCEPKSEFVKGFRTDDGWSNDASLGQRVVLRDLQDSFCLIVKFRADMPSCVVVAFVEVQHGLDMDILLARPLHQVAYQLSSLFGVVNVEHQITNAVNDDQAHVGRMVDGITNDFSSLVRVAMALRWLNFKCSGSLSIGSPANRRMRCITNWQW